MDGGGRLPGTLKRLTVGWPGFGRRAPLPPRGLGSLAVVLFFVAIGVAGFVTGGHYDRFKAEYGTPGDVLASAVGFRVAAVSVSGNKELRPEEVIAAMGMHPGASLPFLDAAGVQKRLAAVPLIAKAAVRKLYPDRLAVRIEERVPFALWQNDGVVHVVAEDGTIIDRLNDRRFLRLPHVVGVGANARAKEFAALLAEVPEMADQVRAASLISERRWTLKLKNGLDVKLPEIGAAATLKRFAALDRDARISDKAILSIDLRVPDKVVLRLTEEAAAQRAQALEGKIKPKGRV